MRSFVFCQVLWPSWTQRAWFTRINIPIVGYWYKWPLEKDVLWDKSFIVSLMDCFASGCSRALLLEQFGPGSEASGKYRDTEGSARTCRWLNSMMGIRTRDGNHWSWSQLHLIYTRYLLIIHSISHQFRLFVWALIAALKPSSNDCCLLC